MKQAVLNVHADVISVKPEHQSAHFSQERLVYRIPRRSTCGNGCSTCSIICYSLSVILPLNCSLPVRSVVSVTRKTLARPRQAVRVVTQRRQCPAPAIRVNR